MYFNILKDNFVLEKFLFFMLVSWIIGRFNILLYFFEKLIFFENGVKNIIFGSKGFYVLFIVSISELIFFLVVRILISNLFLWLSLLVM